MTGKVKNCPSIPQSQLDSKWTVEKSLLQQNTKCSEVSSSSPQYHRKPQALSWAKLGEGHAEPGKLEMKVSSWLSCYSRYGLNSSKLKFPHRAHNTKPSSTSLNTPSSLLLIEKSMGKVQWIRTGSLLLISWNSPAKKGLHYSPTKDFYGQMKTKSGFQGQNWPHAQRDRIKTNHLQHPFKNQT